MSLTFKFDHGYKPGKSDDARTHFEVELRELTQGDLIDAATESESMRAVVEGGRMRYVMARSEEMFSALLVVKQIKRIGTVQGPFDLSMLRTLHIDDWLMLTEQINALDEAALEAATERGRMDEADSGA
ncbi:hypothetical protein F9L16_22745 [Agarivorans sp. B2Z047]|uniref:phage tail assembly protein n=1 Tax=Agarivorans sp. B2Z047 TaxID=2652721 RepID=UPI00128D03E6|nr:phage tail assembly protein [Agarivorans sp. B2Z047]MPW31792.1 hypothetical protein [Agarivorans sp. B2Z047]UQN43743.1 phage tail assembly protein [Agarivorans sp. B2Z047]